MNHNTNLPNQMTYKHSLSVSSILHEWEEKETNIYSSFLLHFIYGSWLSFNDTPIVANNSFTRISSTFHSIINLTILLHQTQSDYHEFRIHHTLIQWPESIQQESRFIWLLNTPNTSFSILFLNVQISHFTTKLIITNCISCIANVSSKILICYTHQP